MQPLRTAFAIAAACGPALLAYNVSPSPTFLNQALAVALWGWFVMATMPPAATDGGGAGTVHLALALVGAGVCWSWGPGWLPTGLAVSALGLVVAAAVMVGSGTGAHALQRPEDVFAAFCWGWVAAGVLSSLVAIVQVFLPAWTHVLDGDLIASSGYPGRAVGNMRQPNHLASLLMWSGIATIALAELRRLRGRAALALLALFVFSVVLSASRTGLVGVLLLALWGLASRRSPRAVRGLMLSAPLLYALAWAAMAAWAHATQATFGAEARLAETDISTSRFGIWANTLALIAREPWTGTGFGEFNFAWSLTAFPGRPTAFFDHTHNLPLQLAVELGLPLAGVVMACLLAGLWIAAGRAWREEGDVGIARRAALAMVVMVGLHSLLEYPLWYAYFLLPAAWAWAFALGLRPRRRDEAGARTSPALAAGAVVLVAGSVLSVLDYTRVTAIFSAAEGQGPLEQRIARGQRSVLFAHHADYAAATTGIGGLSSFDRATHYLLDTRLMMAWAKALAAHGDVDEARWIAARLREFRNQHSDEFFAPCQDPAVADKPFQCQAPEKPHAWRDFLRP